MTKTSSTRYIDAMFRNPKRIILGSNSPRRRELISGLGLEYVVDTDTSFRESGEPGVPPRQVPVDMSVGKSHGFHRPLADDEILVTADTVVIVGDEVLGKPHSREEAVGMLRKLSGRTHEVVTAVTLRSSVMEKTFSVVTEVDFDDIPEENIEYYVDNFRPYDKAGAYAIQEWIGYTGIVGIRGSYYNVMGLPVNRLWHELAEFMK